jgi:hypothetical protein
MVIEYRVRDLAELSKNIKGDVERNLLETL